MRTLLRMCGCGKNSWVSEQRKTCPACKRKYTEIKKKRSGERLQIMPDWKPYLSENLGHEPVWIRSRAHWREMLKRRGRVCVG